MSPPWRDKLHPTSKHTINTRIPTYTISSIMTTRHLSATSPKEDFWEWLPNGSPIDQKSLQYRLRDICIDGGSTKIMNSSMNTAPKHAALRNRIREAMPTFPDCVRNAFARNERDAMHALLMLALRQRTNQMRSPYRHNRRRRIQRGSGQGPSQSSTQGPSQVSAQ